MSATDRGDVVAVVHPATGEVLTGLQEYPPEVLADAWLAVKDRERDLKSMRAELDAELRRRLEMRDRRMLVFGDYEVRVEGSNESQWDADELERVLRELIDSGVLSAREVVDVIHHETIVSRTAANRLLDRLTGPAHAAVAACRTWKRKRPTVRVERAPALPAAKND